MDSTSGVLDNDAKRLARQYAEALKQTLGEKLVSVVLFGSVARGEADAHSDIDVLVVAEDLPRGRFNRRRFVAPADELVDPELARLQESGSAADLCVLLLTPEEARRTRPLYLDMVEDGIILYDRNFFFRQILSQLKERLASLGAQRLRLGKFRYWDLKPDFVPGEVFEL